MRKDMREFVFKAYGIFAFRFVIIFVQSCWGMVQTETCGSVLGGSLKEEQSR